MKLDIKFYVILALLVALVISILTRPIKEVTDLQPYRIQIAEQQLTIDSLSKGRAKLARKIAEDSILQAEEKQAYQESIKGLQARLSKKRILVDSILIDRPEVKEFISMQDSVISLQAVRIDTLQNNLSELRINLSQIQNNFLRQIEQHEEKLKATEALADAYKKEARRSKRSARWLKAGAVALGVGGLFLGAQL